MRCVTQVMNFKLGLTIHFKRIHQANPCLPAKMVFPQAIMLVQLGNIEHVPQHMINIGELAFKRK